MKSAKMILAAALVVLTACVGVPDRTVGWVRVEGMRNVRDIGGWTGLRAGRAFRGAEPDGHKKDGKPIHGLEVTSN